MPTVAPTIGKTTDTVSYKDYYVFTFDSACKDWVSAVSKIQVGTDTYKEVSKTSDISSSNYYVDKENGKIMIYMNSFGFFSGYDVKITSGSSTLSLLVKAEDYYSTPTATIQ